MRVMIVLTVVYLIALAVFMLTAITTTSIQKAAIGAFILLSISWGVILWEDLTSG